MSSPTLKHRSTMKVERTDKEDAMPSTTETLLRLDAVRERTACGRSTIYAMIQRGEFPSPIHIKGTRISAWPASAVDAWVARQIEEAA